MHNTLCSWKTYPLQFPLLTFLFLLLVLVMTNHDISYISLYLLSVPYFKTPNYLTRSNDLYFWLQTLCVNKQPFTPSANCSVKSKPSTILHLNFWGPLTCSCAGAWKQTSDRSLSLGFWDQRLIQKSVLNHPIYSLRGVTSQGNNAQSIHLSPSHSLKCWMCLALPNVSLRVLDFSLWKVLWGLNHHLLRRCLTF